MISGVNISGQTLRTWEPTNAEHWEIATDNSTPEIFGTLDISSSHGNGESKKPVKSVQHDGPEWIKCNNDTGTATTPLGELAEGLPLRKVVGLIVATGQDIPNFARTKFQIVNEFGNTRKMEGHVTDVHKPLASASGISKYHDASIFQEFGAPIPRHSRAAEGLRREYHRLCQLHGDHGILPLYREGRLYTCYLKRASNVAEQGAGGETVDCGRYDKARGEEECLLRPRDWQGLLSALEKNTALRTSAHTGRRAHSARNHVAFARTDI